MTAPDLLAQLRVLLDQHTTKRKVFAIPGPGGVTRVRFEDEDGGSSVAVLVTKGPRNGLWTTRGGYYTWTELLMAFEPLEEA